MSLIVYICRWLDEHEANVAVVHCKVWIIILMLMLMAMIMMMTMVVVKTMTMMMMMVLRFMMTIIKMVMMTLLMVTMVMIITMTVNDSPGGKRSNWVDDLRLPASQEALQVSLTMMIILLIMRLFILN